MAEVPFQPVSTEAAFIGEIPRVDFEMPGSDELADRVARVIGQGPAVLLKNHGLLVAADSLRRAMDITEIIEQSSRTILMCKALGKEPPLLPDEIVTMLKELGQMVG